MGGLGSGGWNSKGSPCNDECFPLSIKSLRRFGFLKPFCHGTLKRGSSSVGIGSWDDRIVLTYQRKGQTDWISVDILFHFRPRHYGGAQVYLVCPKCRRLTTSVYSYYGIFGCRCCHRLPSASQRIREIDRLR